MFFKNTFPLSRLSYRALCNSRWVDALTSIGLWADELRPLPASPGSRLSDSPQRLGKTLNFCDTVKLFVAITDRV